MVRPLRKGLTINILFGQCVRFATLDRWSQSKHETGYFFIIKHHASMHGTEYYVLQLLIIFIPQANYRKIDLIYSSLGFL